MLFVNKDVCCIFVSNKVEYVNVIDYFSIYKIILVLSLLHCVTNPFCKSQNLSILCPSVIIDNQIQCLSITFPLNCKFQHFWFPFWDSSEFPFTK